MPRSVNLSRQIVAIGNYTLPDIKLNKNISKVSAVIERFSWPQRSAARGQELDAKLVAGTITDDERIERNYERHALRIYIDFSFDNKQTWLLDRHFAGYEGGDLFTEGGNPVLESNLNFSLPIGHNGLNIRIRAQIFVGLDLSANTDYS